MARALEWTVSITAAVALYALPMVPLVLAGLELARSAAILPGGGGAGDTGSEGWQEGAPLLMLQGLPEGAAATGTAAETPPPEDDVDPNAPPTPRPAVAKAPKGSPDGSPEGKAEGTSTTGSPDGAPGALGRRNQGSRAGAGSGTGEGGGSGPGKCQPTADPRVRATGRTRWEVDRQILDEYATDWAKLATLGGAWPHEGPDHKVRGIKLRVDPCGVGFQGGMRSGDIVRTVGGHKINSVTAALSTWLDIRNDPEVVVVFVRRGELLEHTYRLRG